MHRLHVARMYSIRRVKELLVTDPAGTIETVNPAFTRLTGYTEEEVVGRNPNFRSTGRQSAEFYTTMWGQIGQEGLWQGKLWNKRKNGDEYLELLSISAVKDDSAGCHTLCRGHLLINA